MTGFVVIDKWTQPPREVYRTDGDTLADLELAKFVADVEVGKTGTLTLEVRHATGTLQYLARRW